MEEKRVVVIPGDGIGPEITRATPAVLDALDCGPPSVVLSNLTTGVLPIWEATETRRTLPKPSSTN